MIFNINAALLDALVLAIVKKEDTYGYEITRVLKNELAAKFVEFLCDRQEVFFIHFTNRNKNC